MIISLDQEKSALSITLGIVFSDVSVSSKEITLFKIAHLFDLYFVSHSLGASTKVCILTNKRYMQHNFKIKLSTSLKAYVI